MDGAVTRTCGDCKHHFNDHCYAAIPMWSTWMIRFWQDGSGFIEPTKPANTCESFHERAK